MACKVDALVEAYGDYLDANAANFDRVLFKNALSDALAGNAFYEIERAAQQLREGDAAITHATSAMPARSRKPTSAACCA